MSFKSTGFALFLLMVPAYCALGPPPGSRGTIDFRYPDYIVEPRPKCLSEGVFPHPRNCSWFFRCHDAYGIGYYQQNYFECAPGTVFSDALDQCIHPYGVSPPCGGALQTPVTIPTPVSIPTEATIPPATPTELPDCYDSMIRCKIYLCPDVNNVYHSIGRLCQTAYTTCKNGTRTFLCSSEHYFQVLTRTCVQNPNRTKCLDEEAYKALTSTTSSTTSTTTTTTTTTTTAPLPPDDCFDSMVECKYYKCPFSPEKEYLCKRAYQTCNFNELYFYCDALKYFNYKTRGCVEPPAQRRCFQLDDLTTTTPPPATTAATALPTTTVVTIDPSLITFSFTVECSTANLRPKEPQLSQYYCSNYATCDPLGPPQVELCLKYLQCVRSSNEWKVLIMVCPPKLYFNYDRDICTTKPDDSCNRI